MISQHSVLIFLSLNSKAYQNEGYQDMYVLRQLGTGIDMVTKLLLRFKNNESDENDYLCSVYVEKAAVCCVGDARTKPVMAPPPTFLLQLCRIPVLSLPSIVLRSRMRNVCSKYALCMRHE